MVIGETSYKSQKFSNCYMYYRIRNYNRNLLPIHNNRVANILRWVEKKKQKRNVKEEAWYSDV